MRYAAIRRTHLPRSVLIVSAKASLSGLPAMQRLKTVCCAIAALSAVPAFSARRASRNSLTFSAACALHSVSVGRGGVTARTGAGGDGGAAPFHSGGGSRTSSSPGGDARRLFFLCVRGEDGRTSGSFGAIFCPAPLNSSFKQSVQMVTGRDFFFLTRCFSVVTGASPPIACPPL
jgi:hypothetical protein